MSNVEDVLGYAWGKNSEELANVVDSIMTARVSDHIASMTADVAAKMFGNVTDDEVSAQDDIPQDNEDNFETEQDLEYDDSDQEGNYDAEEE